MKDIAFKTSFYKKTSWLIFKLIKLITCIKNKNVEDINPLVESRWDAYLAKKFLGESKYNNGEEFNFSRFNRKSDSVVIFGSGSSINNISESQWNRIKIFDSIGLNNFYIHPFETTINFIEPRKNDQIFNYMCNCTAKKKSITLLNIRFVYSSDISIPDKYTHFKFYSPCGIRAKDKILVEKYIKENYKNNRLTHYRSNLDCAIHLSYILGYKNIFLVGVDLYDNFFFWDEEFDKFNLYSEFRRILKKSYNDPSASKIDKEIVINRREKPHTTLSDDIIKDRLSIVDYLYLVNETILKKKDVKLFTVNKKSPLAEKIEYQSLDELF